MANKVDKNFQELTENDDHSDTLPPFTNPVKYITWGFGFHKSQKSKWHNYTNVDDWDDILNRDINVALNMELYIDKENSLMS